MAVLGTVYGILLLASHRPSSFSPPRHWHLLNDFGFSRLTRAVDFRLLILGLWGLGENLRKKELQCFKGVVGGRNGEGQALMSLTSPASSAMKVQGAMRR